MYFPPINAVDDGVFIFVGWAIYSAIYGNQVWEVEYDFFGEKMSAVNIVAFIVNRLMPVYAIIAWKNIFLHRKSEHTQKVWNTTFFTAQILFYFTSVATFHFASVYSVSDIWKTHSRGL